MPQYNNAAHPIIKIQVYSSFCQIYSVTEEALIAETMVWPNFFLMNVFFALKGSKLFIIIKKDWINSNREKVETLIFRR